MKWPKELVEDVARRRAALFLGSGVSASSESQSSAGSHPPTWNAFLTRANQSLEDRQAKRAIAGLIRKNDLLMACEVLKRELDESWTELLRDEFVVPKYRHSELHKALHQLDLPLVLTPNFDTIYDRYVSSETDGATVVKTYDHVDLALILRRKDRVILKVHGSIEHPPKMIFTRSDYAKMRTEYRGFTDVMASLLLTNTFLFVGAGLDDPDMRMFLENYRHTFPGAPPHYMTSPTKEVDARLDPLIRDNVGIKLIRYSGLANHRELLEGIQELVEVVTSRRSQLGISDAW